MDLIIDETLPAVKKFVESGKAKFMGISGYPLTTLLEIVTKSKVNIDCVLSYSRDTLIDDTLQEFIPAFHVSSKLIKCWWLFRILLLQVYIIRISISPLYLLAAIWKVWADLSTFPEKRWPERKFLVAFFMKNREFLISKCLTSEKKSYLDMKKKNLS